MTSQEHGTEPPVPTAEISSKQIWYPVRVIYKQQELALPAVSTRPNTLTQILTGALSLDYLLCILVFLSGQVALIRQEGKPAVNLL